LLRDPGSRPETAFQISDGSFGLLLGRRDPLVALFDGLAVDTTLWSLFLDFLLVMLDRKVALSSAQQAMAPPSLARQRCSVPALGLRRN
jgi:hypothetical protein